MTLLDLLLCAGATIALVALIVCLIDAWGGE